MTPETQVTFSLAQLIVLGGAVLSIYGTAIAMYFRLLTKVNLIANDVEWLKSNLMESVK